MDNSLIFNSPAEQWEEALPLGNGRLGAMVFGIPGREKIQLNEDSIWSGKFTDRNNPAAKEALPVIRKLIDEGKVIEAEEMCIECLSGIPPVQSVYQTAGNLTINFSPAGNFGQVWSGTRGGEPLSKDKIKNYKRKLDISNAFHTLSFEYENIIYKRECFISSPAQVLVLRFTASAAESDNAESAANHTVTGKISFRAGLDRGVFYDRMGNEKNAAFIARDSDIPFTVMMKVKQKGGTQHSAGGFITVENADEALLFLDIRTNFYTAEPLVRDIMNKTDCFETALNNINRQIERSWDDLLQEHIADYHSLYNRVQLELPDDEYTARYFNFCRYLLISCSRPGTLPANLQGIWNHHMDPPWGSDYTININTEMNYWPANMCNLSETEEPLFDLLKRMYPNGKKTADVMYSCRGFAAHHNTNIWGDTAPRDYWLPGSYWALGAAWLCIHIWEHYEYTQDKEFLKKYFYLLKEACLFFVDYLIPGKQANKDGISYLIVSPSSSPENSYLINGDTVCLSAGCEMDNQILRKLFKSALLAADILGVNGEAIANDADSALCEDFSSILERLPPPAIHGNGTIREWAPLNDVEELEEAEPGHRHFSHLFALWPGDEITLEETPELAEAAKKTLERRLSAHGGHTGWSRSWLINFYARLKDGEAALEHLEALYKDFTLPNLFNSHPPFQIDGNFGSLAGITQMLVQSRIGEQIEEIGKRIVIVDILSALPKKWASGSLKGIRAKGNLIIDFSWNNRNFVNLTITNLNNKSVIVKINIKNKPEKLLTIEKKEKMNYNF